MMLYTSARTIAAYSVHFFTALGALLAFTALISFTQLDFQQGFLWLMAGLCVDGIDGTLARRLEVATFARNLNGKYLDLVVDYVNFVFVPAVFFYYYPVLPEKFRWIIISIVLFAGTYNFGLKNDTTDDGYFLGCPAAWHFLAFYIFIFQWPPWINMAMIIGFAALHFIPIKVVYLTRYRPYPQITWALLLLWAGLAISLLLRPNLRDLLLLPFSISSLYFVALSIKRTFVKQARC